MIHYGLHDDDSDFASIAPRIGKYIRRGFRLLYSVQLNIKRFHINQLYVSSKWLPIGIQEIENRDSEFFAELFNDYSNNTNDYQCQDLIWSCNCDYFRIQQKFRFKLLFAFEQPNMFDYVS
ncbi:unnamed protein product [Adineta ricciae]|uniref:Uncharacterized protein n=1 Tax=Adineta ricciae TaxID=249248 RepID=A0A815FKC3_ADIRI|nr:unnamed protein product [Adineta ricciae]CAF1469497.1 unnamed protein product [Adineta ricciae]